MRRRLLAQVSGIRLGTAWMFEDVDTELKQRIDSLIKKLEGRITGCIASDKRLSEPARVRRSIPEIVLVASTAMTAEMFRHGSITGKQAAALTGLTRGAHVSGAIRGKRAISGDRRALRKVMFQTALVTAHHKLG
ncbi:transposase [Falsigemmobacter faecalis]|nr:transposase [Falsigemmobacter faecalis]